MYARVRDGRRLRIAVIGGGVTGLGAALALDRAHDVTLYEKERRLGGHANTATIEYDGRRIAVDTGFIVFNEANYPNFTALLAHLGVASVASDMSFALSDANGAEWSSNGLAGLFAWKRNLANPGFLDLLGDIVRFNATARADLANGRVIEATLEDYVARLRLGERFLRDYLLPMGAAIWSTPEDEMRRYPAENFLRFFDNHRLLHARRPQWRTIEGGSATYVAAARAALSCAVREGGAVVAVTKESGGWRVRTAAGADALHDHVVFACHADEAMALTPSARAKTALAAIRYAPNIAYLHRDAALMPKRRAAWASWNYLRGRGETHVCVTYWMNALQPIDPSRPLFVTLNPPRPPDAENVFAQFHYDHPQFDAAALAARAEIAAMQGEDGLWHAGAWLGSGFHEDGLRAGLDVARALGGAAPWERNAPRVAALA